MLCELMSDEYIAYDKPRGRITFHPGLNTVLGGKQIFIAYDKQEAPTPRYKRFSMKRQSSISVRTATNCSATHGPRRQTRKRM